MKTHDLTLPEGAVDAICRRHHIRKLALFGSAVRGELLPESDLDVLVEFEEGHVPGFAFFDIERELSEALGRKVDLNTSAFLSPRVRRNVEAEAEVVFGPD